MHCARQPIDHFTVVCLVAWPLNEIETSVDLASQLCVASSRGGGDSHMKQTGMLVVSLRGVNFGFWSRLGCSGQSANILCHQGLV